MPLKNLSKAFEVTKEQYKGKTALIIDDICTTGSTFEEMVNELKNNGIEHIVDEDLYCAEHDDFYEEF